MCVCMIVVQLFTVTLLLCIVHSYSGAPKKLSLKLPVFVTKFLQGTSMNSQDFFKRWKQLGSEPSQEVQKIFSGKFPCNPEAIKENVSIDLINSCC